MPHQHLQGFDHVSKLSDDKRLTMHRDVTLFQYLTTLSFKDPRKNRPFENVVGKEENAGNQHFLLFPQCFLFYGRQKFSSELNLCCRLLMPSICYVQNSVV